MASLGFTFADVEIALGLPLGYSDVTGIPVAEKLRILSRDFDQLDVATIERIARRALRGDGAALEFPPSNGSDLVDHAASKLSAGVEDSAGNPRDVFVRVVVGRIRDQERS